MDALHESLWDCTTRVIHSPTVLNIMSNRSMILGRGMKGACDESILQQLADLKAASWRPYRPALISTGLPLECNLCADIYVACLTVVLLSSISLAFCGEILR